MQLEWQIPTFAKQVMKELGTGRSRGFGFVSVLGVDGGIRWGGRWFGGVAMVYVYKYKLSKNKLKHSKYSILGWTCWTHPKNKIQQIKKWSWTVEP